MDLRCPVKWWWRVLGLAVFLACGGCAEGAKLVQERASGGVVTYPYKEDRGGPMFSGFRKEAVGVMANKCPSGYTIQRRRDTRVQHGIGHDRGNRRPHHAPALGAAVPMQGQLSSGQRATGDQLTLSKTPRATLRLVPIPHGEA